MAQGRAWEPVAKNTTKTVSNILDEKKKFNKQLQFYSYNTSF